MPFTMLFSFYNNSQLLQVWADRTSLNPRKWSLHVDTRGGVNASIKGKENQWRKGRGHEVLEEENNNIKLLGRGRKTVKLVKFIFM